jgi:hypothetical protein
MQVYGAGGKTTPKAGRNGTGSYYPAGTPLIHRTGNVFPGFNPEKQDFHQTTFGDVSRASVATAFGQNRTGTRGIHPNKSEYNVNTQVLAPAMTVSSMNDLNNLQPTTPFGHNTLAMPHERNTNSASGTKKKPNPYRTAFGAAASMPNDGSFVDKPQATYVHTVRNRPKSAIEAVKQHAVDGRTFAQQTPESKPGSSPSPTKQLRTPPASFVSRNNVWSDPNNSFVGGNNTPAGRGTGRWSVVKKGVV